MVSKIKAKSPIAMISRVSVLTKLSACILKEIVMPRNRVIRLARVFCAVSDMVPRTPHSRIRLPNMRKPTRETLVGAMRPTINVTTIGNAIRTLLETDEAW